MKILIIIIFILYLPSKLVAQECFVENKKYLKNDYSQVWSGETFQGVIGSKNQRIEMRFTSIAKLNDSTYAIKGKSKVNSNICDYYGELSVKKAFSFDENNIDCDGPEAFSGYLLGKYELYEDKTQKHVGQFEGEFKTFFSELDKVFVVAEGLYSQEGISEFKGTWKEYNKNISKYCSWGMQIPPTPRNDLIINYENEVYIFNKKYLSRGWENYVVANYYSFIIVPLDFKKMKRSRRGDIMTYTREEIESFKKIENYKWWK